MKIESANNKAAPLADGSTEVILLQRRKKIFSIYSLLFLLLSLALLWWLIEQLDTSAFWLSLNTIRFDWAAVALGFYLLSNQLKAFRYQLVLGDVKIEFAKMAAITSYQNFFNQIMPARTGELTLLYYLKKIAHLSGSVGIHALILTRIYDLIIVALGFSFSLLLHFGWQIPGWLLTIAVLFLITALALLFLMRFFLLWGKNIFLKLSKLAGIEQNKITVFIKVKLENLEGVFRKAERDRRMPAMIASSLLIWLALYLFAYATIRAFQVDISLLLSIAGSTGQILANVLPVNSFGSFGTLEAGWAGGYMLVGMNRQDAITTGFGYHLLNFLGSAVIAAFFYLLLKIKNRK